MSRGYGALEPAEDALLVFWGDADALVPCNKGSCLVIGMEADLDRLAVPKFDRIGDEVHDQVHITCRNQGKTTEVINL